MASPRIGNRLIPLLLLLLLAACGEEPAAPPTPRMSDEPPAPQAPPPAGPPKPSANQPQAPPAPKGSDAGRELEPMPATVARDTELKAKPFIDAKSLASLTAGSAVTVLERRGGWFRVASGEREGWVRLLYVSTQAGARGIGTEELESAARIATGRQGGGNVANTTGVRGLTPEQLREAQPDTGELERLEANGIGAEQALAYARKRGLERREVPFLPEPE